MKRCNAPLPIVVVSLIFIVAASALWAVPPHITISGYVEDNSGAQLDGTFQSQVIFYPTATGGVAFDSFTTSTVISRGIFDIVLTPSPAILGLDELWYSVAIDTNGNGLDSLDLFSSRFQVTSVPYALAVPPATFFNTLGGIMNLYSGPLMTHAAGSMFVAPFNSPPGGVIFDKISAFFSNQGGSPVTISFGIYNDNGTMVIQSGSVVLPDGFSGFKQVSVSGKLRSQARYYTAWATNTAGNLVAPGQAALPSSPGFGYVDGVVTGGQLPSSFNTSQISAILSFPGGDQLPAINICLSKN